MNEIELIESEANDDFSNDDLFNITSWGADINLREIVTSYTEGDFVKPELQRNYVWDKKDASRFIESILLGLPVPSVFLASADKGKKLIVDGYQRISTIVNYYNGFWSPDNSDFKLSDTERINERWRGKSFKDLTEEDQRRFKLYTIHAIIFEQKTPKNDDGLYQIFERINTSGKTLNPQEIRNCVYQGKLNTLLFKLNKNEKWRELFGEKQANSRMMDLEFILRFLALRQSSILENKAKSISLKKVLNDYMNEYREGDDSVFKMMEDSFNKSIDFIYEKFGVDAFYNLKNDLTEVRRKFYPTIYDSIMIATLIALDSGYKTDEQSLQERRIELLKDLEYRQVITQGTMALHSIRTRIQKALYYLFDIEKHFNEE